MCERRFCPWECTPAVEERRTWCAWFIISTPCGWMHDINVQVHLPIVTYSTFPQHTYHLGEKEKLFVSSNLTRSFYLKEIHTLKFFSALQTFNLHKTCMNHTFFENKKVQNIILPTYLPTLFLYHYRKQTFLRPKLWLLWTWTAQPAKNIALRKKIKTSSLPRLFSSPGARQ